MHARRSLASLLIAGVTVAACAGPPAPSGGSGDPPAEPAVASTTEQGLAVTLTVDRSRVGPGDDVVATVSVRNVLPGVVTWQGGGCELEGDFTVTPTFTIASAPIGHAWDGDKNVLKQLALPEAYTIRPPVPPRFAHVDVAFACPANLAYHELKPGEEAHATIVWVASMMAGSPAPAGDYVVAVGVPFVGRDIPDPILNPAPDQVVTPIVAQLLVSVEDHPPVPPAVDAMDAVLGDPAFTAWLAEHRRDSWNSTAIRFVDGAWVVQVRYDPERMLSASRDPATGVVGLSVGPAPRPNP